MIDDDDFAPPLFLDRLKIDLHADVATIRRAYARELKLLDQERDADEFQVLRQCYEQALARARQDPQPAAIPHDLPNMAVVARHEDVAFGLAETVFARFNLDRAILIQPGTLYDPARWTKALLLRLEDKELINFSARMGFEARIADLLSLRWERGHESLFLAAIGVFDWINDGKRLLAFGRAGARLDQTIFEHAMFGNQPEMQLAYQRSILDRLRREGLPEAAQLKRDISAFRMMLACFPHMMAVRVDPAKIAQWQSCYEELKAANGGKEFAVRVRHAAPPPPEEEKGHGFLHAFIWLAVITVLALSRCHGERREERAQTRPPVVAGTASGPVLTA